MNRVEIPINDELTSVYIYDDENNLVSHGIESKKRKFPQLKPRKLTPRTKT